MHVGLAQGVVLYDSLVSPACWPVPYSIIIMIQEQKNAQSFSSSQRKYKHSSAVTVTEFRVVGLCPSVHHVCTSSPCHMIEMALIVIVGKLAHEALM